MMNPLLKRGMVLYTGILGPESKQGDKPYRIIFNRNSSDTRGGIPTEAVSILKALDIPLEEHWDRDMKKQGWMCSHYIKTEITRSLENVNPFVQEFLQSGVTNTMFLSLLKEV